MTNNPIHVQPYPVLFEILIVQDEMKSKDSENPYFICYGKFGYQQMKHDFNKTLDKKRTTKRYK